MKKIIAVLTLFLAFNLTASAQQNKVSENKNAEQKIQLEKDIMSLTRILRLDDQLKRDFVILSLDRIEAMDQVVTPEDKKAVFTKYANKMFGVFKPEQIEILKKNDIELYNRLAVFKE
jgi:hypothetical protein